MNSIRKSINKGIVVLVAFVGLMFISCEDSDSLNEEFYEAEKYGTGQGEVGDPKDEAEEE